MSGYPDEPRDNDRDRRDRDPDDRDRDDRDDRAERRDERDIRIAKSQVQVPAIGLILVGALTILSALLGLIQLPVVKATFDKMIEQVDKDPNVPPQQKKQQIEMFTTIRDFFVNYGALLYAATAVLGVVIVVGGVRLMQLGSSWLVVLGSLGAMLPFSACCLLGLVFGIWALVALANPKVKAGFAAKRRLSTAPPDAY
jgi:hypothetical protein